MKANIGMLIGLFVSILIAIVLLGPLATQVNQFQDTNSSKPYYVSPSEYSIVTLIPLFFVLVILIIPAVLAYKIYRER
ncbi:VP1/VP3 family protein [Metallosphaera sedula]|uniref:VP1/VP3 family protein n=1 Tax=Metallosphaera sedula TaxID=43687 RepID=UPI0020BD54BF|nr:VP1/VP3 family protein [Metallosphaera sedula]BBL46002.1 hypothetical protein MJ1HA_0089 [Metallosphaera sedula]BBL46084.1 hypothetical protein MJ1HA_0176 [Metallosphaera sedula]